MTMTPALVLAVGALFVSLAVAAGYVIVEVLQRTAPARHRLHSVAGADGILAANLSLAADQPDPRLARANRFLPKSSKDMSRLQKRMNRAGYRGATPALVYSIVELALPTILALVCLYLLGPRRGLL